MQLISRMILLTDDNICRMISIVYLQVCVYMEGDECENTFTLAINTDHRLHLPMMSRGVLVSIWHPK